MNEKKIILTEKQLDEALRLAAMGGAGLLHPADIANTLKELPKEIGKKALASALAAGCIRAEGPKGVITKITEMMAREKDKD